MPNEANKYKAKYQVRVEIPANIPNIIQSKLLFWFMAFQQKRAVSAIKGNKATNPFNSGVV